MMAAASNSDRAERYGRGALDRQCVELSSVVADRNRTLNAAAFSMGRLVGAGCLDYNIVETSLFAAAQANGYVGKDGPRAARATIRSGLSRGVLHPRELLDRDRFGSRWQPPSPAEIARRQEMRRRAEAAARADAVRRQRLAFAIWEASQDPRGRLPDTYLRSRKLAISDTAAVAALRFLEACPCGEGRTAPAMVALQRDVLTGEPKAVHRTFLAPDGRKVSRKMLGDAYGTAVMLDPFEDVAAGITTGEGIESCLAARQFGISPVWAMTSTSMVGHMPVLPGIESLTLLVENDANGASDRACAKTALRWHEAGRAVDFVRPPNGAKDLNDVLMGGAAA